VLHHRWLTRTPLSVTFFAFGVDPASCLCGFRGTTPGFENAAIANAKTAATAHREQTALDPGAAALGKTYLRNIMPGKTVATTVQRKLRRSGQTHRG